MKKRLFYSISSLLLLICLQFAVTSCTSRANPSEIAIVRLYHSHDEDKLNRKWQIVKRVLSDNKATVEYIPADQDLPDWSDLLTIQYAGEITSNNSSIDALIDRSREEVIHHPQGREINWNVLSKTKSDAIYEWTLDTPSKNIRSQHEISRIILTKNGMHRISFTKKNETMNDDEKRMWMHILENTPLVKWEDAVSDAEGFSFIDRTKLIVDGSSFPKWERGKSVTSPGVFLEMWYPSMHRYGIETEYLEVYSTASMSQSVPFYRWVEKEKNNIEKSEKGKSCFIVHKETPKEIIYIIAKDSRKDQIIGMCRFFRKGTTFYGMHYRCSAFSSKKVERLRELIQSVEDVKVERVVDIYE